MENRRKHVANLFSLPLILAAGSGVRVVQVVAPLAGLLMSVRVGWTRPEVLEGYHVGEAVLELLALILVPGILISRRAARNGAAGHGWDHRRGATHRCRLR